MRLQVEQKLQPVLGLAEEAVGVVEDGRLLVGQTAGRDEGLKIARESLLEVRDIIQGVQVSAPFGNVKYALEVFSVLNDFAAHQAAIK